MRCGVKGCVGGGEFEGVLCGLHGGVVVVRVGGVSGEQLAVAVVNRWLAERGVDVSRSSERSWDVAVFREGWVLSARVGSEGVLFVVVGEVVVRFSAARMSVAEAYEVARAGGG